MTTVLHVVESFSSGTLQAVRMLCWAIARETVCYVLHGDRGEGSCGKPEGFPPEVSFIPWSVGREIAPLLDYQALVALKKTVSKIQPDVIHAHSSKAGALVRIAFPFGKIPILYSPHGYSFLRRDLKNYVRGFYWCIEWMLGWVPQVTVACGFAEYGYARSLSNQTLCLHNVIDRSTINKILNNRETKNPKTKDLLVGTAGGIRPQKNFPLFCEVASACNGSGIRFLWIGGGEIPPSVSVPDNLEITGWVDHFTALSRLATCDVYMQTSLWEGLSIAVIEGMALGLPVLANPAPGNVELVFNDKNGYLCDSVNQFVTHLQSLHQNRETLRKLSIASRDFVEQEFSVQHLAPKWLNLYQKCTHDQ
ncbi:Glycosyltransferase involved in cell wall bisynthesis [Gammaproteobacteria bacterium]